MFRDSAMIARNVQARWPTIGALIVRGDVLPGDPLPSEVKICEMLDVSRTVVREAICTQIGKGWSNRAPQLARVRPREEWNQLDVDAALAARAHRRRQLSPRSSSCATPWSRRRPHPAATAATDEDRAGAAHGVASDGGRPGQRGLLSTPTSPSTKQPCHRQPQRILLADRFRCLR